MIAVKIIKPLYIRKGPGRSYGVLGTVYPSGNVIAMNGVEDGENWKGISKWFYQINEKNEKQWYWSGATLSATPDKKVYTKLGWNLQRLNIPALWEHTKGENTSIAIIDTGITMAHPEFNYKQISGWNILTGTDDYNDSFGHGTQCAGIIKARGVSVFGAAPEAGLLVIKAANDGDHWDISNLIKAIDYALDKNVDIISISGFFGAKNESISELHAKVKEAIDANISIIAAAGNNRSKFVIENYPAAFPECISVGSIDENDIKADASAMSVNLDLVAPGQNILSTALGSTYQSGSGTSFATPLVAGAAALIASAFLKRTGNKIKPGELRILLTKTAADIGETGFDTASGYGIIDPLAAFNKINT